MIPSILTALVASLTLQPLAIRYARRSGLVDIPNHRSSHSVPTPRSGGVAVVIAVLLGGLVALGSVDQDRELVVLHAVSVCAFGVLGLLDDRRGLDAALRLLAQSALAIATVTALWLVGFAFEFEAGMALGILAAAAVVAFVNAFNFMDGIDGISGLSAAVAGTYLAAVTSLAGLDVLALLAGVTAAAAVGFVPWNAPHARVFLGDVGSYAVGASLILIVVMASGSGVNWMIAASAVFIYGLDTGTTLLRRAARGESLLVAHREHVYQRVTDTGFSHLVAATACASFSALICGWALTLAWTGWSPLWMLPVLALCGAAYLMLPRAAAAWRRSAARSRTSVVARGSAA